MSALYGVIGDPVAHSLSPLIHKGWMREHGLDADYLALQVPEGTLAESLETLKNRGFRGLNVTLPHKEAAFGLARTVTPAGQKIGAINTLWLAGDQAWHGDNTDAPGFSRALSDLLDKPLKGQTVLVFGAGGAARGIIYALDAAGALIHLANRTLQRAENLLAEYHNTEYKACSFEEGLVFAADCDLVINTASLGHDGEVLNLPLGNHRLFYDISYGKAADLTLNDAKSQGWRTADGLSMLVWQAAYAFERWFGILPETDDALQRCRRTIEAAT